jgi:two-component system sensor histidine kinase MprB
MSLRARLTLAAAAAVAIAVLLASVVVFVFVRSQLLGQVDDSLRDGANAIAARPPPVNGLPVRGFGLRLFQAPGLRPVRVYVQFVTPAGVVTPPGSSIPATARTRAVAAAQSGAFFGDATVDGQHARVYTAPAGGRMAVQIARPLTEVDRTLHRLGWILLGVLLVGIGVAAGLGLLVARSALRPVAELTRAVEDVTRTRDLARRIELSGSDEVARLAGGFNTMLAALQESVLSQRQLVADASHELRTPLTSIRTNVEVLARADDLPAPERDRLLADLTAQSEELSSLVDDLVELARGNQEPDAVEDVRLDEIVERAVRRAASHSPQIAFATRVEPSLVRASPDRVDRAVRNLLDNAAKWSSPGAEVEVAVSEGVVTVRDHGPGIEPADLPHVFDRFYRAPSARGLPGSGLGLSIVRQVAESHHGSVSAENAEDGGACFTLRLPIANVETGALAAR